jgi:O-antigen/teichoic acid export membrane protein
MTTSITNPAGPRAQIRTLWSDTILRSAGFLTLSQGAVAIFGLVFWVVSAHLTNAGAVGQATTLISASILIAYLSVFGINVTFMRFLPTSNQRDAELSSGFAFCFTGALLLSLGYVELLPVIAPKLEFVQRSLPFTVTFVLFTAFGALNLLTDSVFIAHQQAKYIFWSDGIVQGTVKVVTPFALIAIGVYATYGAFGIFSSFGSAATADVIASVVLIVARLGYRPGWRVRLSALTPNLRYTATNYAVSVLDIIPTLILPTIVLDGLGSHQAGYFYIAFQVAGLLSGIGVSIALSALSEGAQHNATVEAVARRSRFLLTLTVPLFLLAGLAVTPWALIVFGSGYQMNARNTFVVLVLAVPAVALCQWTRALLQITRQLRPLLASQFLYAAVILVLSVATVHRGTTWIAAAYVLGNLVAGAVAGVAYVLRGARYRTRPGAHAKLERYRTRPGAHAKLDRHRTRPGAHAKLDRR